VRVLHPGFLMLLAGELAADPGLDLDEEKLSQVLASNLCRCTGYVGIRRAAVAAASGCGRRAARISGRRAQAA